MNQLSFFVGGGGGPAFVDGADARGPSSGICREAALRCSDGVGVWRPVRSGISKNSSARESCSQHRGRSVDSGSVDGSSQLTIEATPPDRLLIRRRDVYRIQRAAQAPASASASRRVSDPSGAPCRGLCSVMVTIRTRGSRSSCPQGGERRLKGDALVGAGVFYRSPRDGLIHRRRTPKKPQTAQRREQRGACGRRASRREPRCEPCRPPRGSAVQPS
jgi:hypothetical protein